MVCALLFKCKVHAQVYAGLGVQKHALYVDHINKAITGLFEFGIIDHFYYQDVPLKSFVKESVKKIQAKDAPQPLKIITFVSSILFLLVIHCFSLMIFMLERRQRPKRNVKGHSMY